MTVRTTLWPRDRKTTEFQLLEEYYFDDSEKGQSLLYLEPQPSHCEKVISYLYKYWSGNISYNSTPHPHHYLTLRITAVCETEEELTTTKWGFIWSLTTTNYDPTQEDHWYITTPHQTLALHFSHFHIFPWTRSCLLAMNENQESVTMQLTDNPHPQLPGGDQSQMFMVYPPPDTGLFPPP